MIGKVLSPTRTLNSDETAKVLSTCYAFRSLWTEFRSNRKGEEVTFQYEGLQCEKNQSGVQIEVNQELKTTLVHLLDSAPLIFDSPEILDYVREVETHLHGRLSPLCQKLMKGEPASNIIDGPSGQKWEYSFRTEGAREIYEIAIARYDATTGSYVHRDQEIYEVLVRPSKAKQQRYLGMVMRSERRRTCLDGISIAEFMQEFKIPD